MFDVINAAAAALATIDLTGVDFTPIVSSIESAVPAVLPGVITIVGVRKTISFVIGAIRGA